MIGSELDRAARSRSWAQAGEDPLHPQLGRDVKGRISPVFYIAGMVFAALAGSAGGRTIGIALACYVGVALLWLIPDARIERAIVREQVRR